MRHFMYLECGGEVAEAGDDALVQRVGALHGELQHDGIDAEGGDAEEDAGEDDQPGHVGLDEGPAHEAQHPHRGDARRLAHQRHLPCKHHHVLGLTVFYTYYFNMIMCSYFASLWYSFKIFVN